MCTDEQHQAKMDAISKIEKHTRRLTSHRGGPIDENVAISSIKGYVLDYKDRHHVFIYSPVSLTLDLGDGMGRFIVPASSWTEINFRTGSKIFAVNQSADVLVLIRASDRPPIARPPVVPFVAAALVPLAANPTQTAAAAADTSYAFGNGSTQFNHCSIQNNTASNVFYAFDQSATVAGNQIYVLSAGGLVFWDRAATVLHFASAAQQNFGGQTGITVEAFA